MLTCALYRNPSIRHVIRSATKCNTMHEPSTMAATSSTAYSERSFESPYESKGKGPVMSYEKFVQLLDAEDPVAQKAIDILVQDVFTRARSRKQAIEEARQYHQHSGQPTYSSIAAAAAAHRDQVGAEARRAWHGEVPSLSQRLHGWRYLHADDTDRQQHRHNAAEDTIEYDAIIADARRQVASPLPMLNLTTGSQDPHEEEPLFDSTDWPDLNPGIYGHQTTTWSDDDDSEVEDHNSRVRAVERALAAVQAQRDTARTNLTRLATIQGNGASSANTSSNNTASSRLRILQRLEQRRRDLMERAEQQRANASSANRSYPSYFNTSFQRTSTENVDRDVSAPNDNLPPTIPIIVGGDFSNLPPNPSSPQLGPLRGLQTIRTSYEPLQRNNSIRRSGFHATRGQQSSPPNANAALSAANALLPRTSSRPLSTLQPPRSPLYVAGSSSEPVPAVDATQRQELDTLFGRQSSSDPWELDTSHGAEVSSFESFTRASRQASRGAREDEEGGQDRRNVEGPAATDSTALPSFLLSPSHDPMLGGTTADGDSITELLGSSSSVAGLGDLNTGSSRGTTAMSLEPFGSSNHDSRRSIIPPRAPILSRRSFPLDSPAITPASANPSNSSAATSAQASNPSQALPPRDSSPQRASSVPERRPIRRPEEILHQAYFPDEVPNTEVPTVAYRDSRG